jgi:hypothetical protein
VAKLVARLLGTAAFWALWNPEISQKYKMGDISKEVTNTLRLAKIVYFFSSPPS